MHVKPPRVGEILAGAFGALLLVSLFLPWYREKETVCIQVVGAECPEDGTGSAWETFAVLDVFLLILALAGIGLLAVEVTQRTPAIPVAWSAIAALLGLIGIGLVLWRTLSPPPAWVDAEPVFALLALFASAGLTAGCLLSMRNEAASPSPDPGPGPAPIRATGSDRGR